VVDLGSAVDVEDVHGAHVFFDAINDPVGSPAGSVAAGQGPNSGLPTRCGFTANAASQNSRTAAATDSGRRSENARRAAGWNRISYRLAGSLSAPGGTAPGQILADGGQISTGLAMAQRGQAL
jgi:hypothetical protein